MYVSIQMLKICLDLQRNCLHTMKISQEVQLLIYLFFQVKQIIIKKVQLPIKTFLKLRGTCLQKFKSLWKWLIAASEKEKNSCWWDSNHSLSFLSLILNIIHRPLYSGNQKNYSYCSPPFFIIIHTQCPISPHSFKMALKAGRKD